MSITTNPINTDNTPKIFGGTPDDHDACPMSSTQSPEFENDDHDRVGQEEDSEDDDDSDNDGRSRSRSDSSGSHFVLEKTRRNSGFGSKDPLFRAVYLHDGSMTTEQFETYRSTFCNDPGNKNSSKKNSNHRNQSSNNNGTSWSASLLNIFSLRNN
mmetsp:Transcript_25736/g.56442  ORF Transcript_25736/g.56442 Transcript_25736/m.56442 type:complete len:156 (-) Transcript_25736:110-577(-)